jgi:hypothetical protein
MAQAGYTPISLYYSTTAAAVPVNTNLASGELAINITDGKLYYKNNGGTVTLLASSAGSSGDVVGPASATANGIALFNSTTGKLIKDSAASDGLIHGLTVGRGAGAVSDNTVVGSGALAVNTSGARNSAFGIGALAANITGTDNAAFGRIALTANIASGNNAFGSAALYSNTSGGLNQAFGDGALFNNILGSRNVAKTNPKTGIQRSLAYIKSGVLSKLQIKWALAMKRFTIIFTLI